MQASRTSSLLDVIRHDEEVKFRGDMSSVPTWPHLIGLELSQWIIPTLIMVGLSVLLVFLVRRIYLANTREILIALFTGFVTAYLLTTFVGTAMRGTSMELFSPWTNPGVHEG